MARPPLLSPTPPPPEDAPPGTYALEGSVIQAGDGMGRGRPGREGPWCTITAWHISRGQVTGVDVSGVTLVAVGRRDGGSVRRVLFLDEGIRPEQVRSLLDLFQGRLGVSWAGLRSDADQEVGAYQVPIELDRLGLSVQGRLRLVLGQRTGELWVEVPELELAWRSSRCPAARARFLVEG